MSNAPVNLLIVSPQPAQHENAALAALASGGRVVPHVAYLSSGAPDPRAGAEYLTREAFAGHEPRGYSWSVLPNRSPAPSPRRFWGLWNPGAGRLAAAPRFDACLVYGYAYASCWLAIRAARRTGKALLLSTDATSYAPRDGAGWKVPLKRLVVPRILRCADVVVVPSTASAVFARGFLSADRVVLTPYVFDNDAFAARACAADVAAVRAGWGVPRGAAIVLFVGKFIARKRPQDVLRALARLGSDVYGVLVGAGPLEQDLREEAHALGIGDRVRFPGLVPYGSLPAAYAAASVVVATSEHEPWGLTVGEAMACARPVAASDRVGAAADLVAPGETGAVYHCGDPDGLTAALRPILADAERAAAMGRAGQRRMTTWGPAANAAALADAVERAVGLRGAPR